MKIKQAISLKAASSKEKSGVLAGISVKQKSNILSAMSDVLQNDMKRSNSVYKTAKCILKLLLQFLQKDCEVYLRH